MLTILDGRLKVASQPPQEEIVPFLSAFCQMARGNRVIRKYLRQEVLPPLGRVGTTRPEEGNLIRNGLVRLMTSPVGDIKVGLWRLMPFVHTIWVKWTLYLFKYDNTQNTISRISAVENFKLLNHNFLRCCTTKFFFINTICILSFFQNYSCLRVFHSSPIFSKISKIAGNKKLLEGHKCFPFWYNSIAL